MSTRSIIGTIDPTTGNITGTYIHDGGNPALRGPVLTTLTARHGARIVLDQITAPGPAWSNIDPAAPDTTGITPDIDAPRNTPAYAAALNQRVEATSVVGWGSRYAEGEDSPITFTTTLDAATPTADLKGLDWLWLFSTDLTTLYVISHDRTATTPRALRIQTFPVIDLPTLDPSDWERIECGDDWEHCPHYARAHYEVPAASRDLNTAQWLGRTPLDHTEAIAVVTNGVRYNLSGSGSTGTWLRLSRRRERGPHIVVIHPMGRAFSPNGWYQYVREDVPRPWQTVILTRMGTGGPVPGVTYVLPPTNADVMAGREEVEQVFAAL